MTTERMTCSDKLQEEWEEELLYREYEEEEEETECEWESEYRIKREHFRMLLDVHTELQRNFHLTGGFPSRMEPLVITY